MGSTRLTLAFFSVLLQHHVGLEDINPTAELTDTEDNDEEDLGVLDDQRSIILHLLSQLKLGMDLTRVCTARASISRTGGQRF